MALQAIMLTGVAMIILAMYLTKDFVMWNQSVQM